VRKSKELLGMPVVSLEEGLRVGRVTGLVVDPAAKTVAALIVEKGGLFREQRFIPFPQVYSIGANAVTLHRSQQAAKGASLPEILRLFKEKIAVTGAKVVAENGAILGHVTEYFVDTVTGAITGLEIAPAKPAFVQGVAHLDSGFIRTIGKEIIVVTDEASRSLTPVDGGLKKRASQTWEEVKSKSQQFSESISTKIKNLRHSAQKPSEGENSAEPETKPPGDNQSKSFDTERSS
jgi:uncharacterized protein YrrD